ncbi:MAG TPA: Rrf2 family transcriptional regulator, partial [Isosphaeraceae bacterium]|nr:Rrf2 family transcriptional regulator [Isosphaeraceae bacterium]
EIADFYQISANHLGKVVQQLGRLGYVRSVRGPGGGMELAKPPERVSVGEVVRAFEGTNLHLLACVQTPGLCRIQPGCSLRHVLAEAERRQMDYLDSVMLDSLLPASSGLEAFLVEIGPLLN